MAENLSKYPMNKAIVFLNTAKAWGGGEKWHFEVAQHLYQKGVPVVIVAHPYSELLKRAQHAGVPVKTLNIGNLNVYWPGKWWQLYQCLKPLCAQTLLINLSRDLKIGSLVGRWLKIPRIIYRRGSAIPIKKSLLNRLIFSYGIDEILANSIATKKTVNALDPHLFPQTKIRVIYNGIDTAAFATPPKEVYYQRKSNELVLTHLGRLEREKNQRFLIELAHELRLRKIPFHLILGGIGSQEESLKAHVNAYHLESFVSFVGFVKNPTKLYHSGDLFVLPSLWEGFGYVLAEAGASQKPVIAFEISSIPEIIQDQQTGFLSPLNDVYAFADRVEQLYFQPHFREELGVKAQKFAQQTFEKKIIFKQIENYLINKDAASQD